MATIIINAITYRAACTDALGAADLAAYDEARDRVLGKIGDFATNDGFVFRVDEQGQGAASYRVIDESNEIDLQNAHEFMQSNSADFWSIY